MSPKKPLVLIVDDEKEMCWALEHILNKSGIRAIKAYSGEEAIGLTQSNQFNIAFVDAKLPDMEGLELAHQLHELLKELPIVMVSGYFYKDDEMVQKAIANGVICEFIGKPFLNEDIVKTISLAK